jgi:uncharacterized damage-inducible protein DinB
VIRRPIGHDVTMATRYADVFVDQDEDPRIDPPFIGDERTILTSFLTWHRDTLDLKCQGVDPGELAAQKLPPSKISLLGLVRHMAEVERGWFRRCMAGEDAKPLYYGKDGPDDDWEGAVADPAVIADAWEKWRAEIAFADEFIANAPDFEITGQLRDGTKVSLRWVLAHLVEEYARHVGHADILREQIDGRVGQ